MHTFQVIIIGAGISGLSAARTLIQNGMENILILEAKEKVGGRICTMDFGDSLIELGAQWIHGEENELFELVKETQNLHNTDSWEGKGNFFTPSGVHINGDLVDKVNEWVGNTLGNVEDNIEIETYQNEPNKWEKNISMGSFLRQEFKGYLDNCKDNEQRKLKIAMFQWEMNFQRIDNSCNQMSELSLFRWSEYKANGNHVYKNFKGGGQHFVDEILVTSTIKSKIRLNKPVVSIDWTDDIINIKTASKSDHHFQCKTVLVTCSIGVLKETHHKLFTPQLPAYFAEALKCSGYGPLTKIFLEWEEAWWPNDFIGIQFAWPDENIDYCGFDCERDNIDISENWYKSITGFDPVLDNPNVLLAWLGGPEAVYVESLSSSDVGMTCTKLLRQFTGNQRILTYKSVAISKWNTDPYFRGAYSNRSKQGDKIPGNITAILTEPIYKIDIDAKKKPVLLLAGEALHCEYYSTLHGAFESGQSQAKKIVQHFKT